MALIENQDYYYENGLLVFTAKYHLERGYCCKNGCRHCPYGFSKGLTNKANTDKPDYKANSDSEK